MLSDKCLQVKQRICDWSIIKLIPTSFKQCQVQLKTTLNYASARHFCHHQRVLSFQTISLKTKPWQSSTLEGASKDAQSPSITTNYQLPIRLQNIKERKEMETTLELAKKSDVVHIYFETTTTSRNWIKICIAISYSLIKGILFLNKTK